jgi:hypothetical protein
MRAAGGAPPRPSPAAREREFLDARRGCTAHPLRWGEDPMNSEDSIADIVPPHAESYRQSRLRDSAETGYRYASASGASPIAVIVAGPSWPSGCRPRPRWKFWIATCVPSPHTPSTAPL